MTSGGLLFFLLVRLLGVTSCSDGLSVLLVLVDSPVEDIVILEGLADKEIAKDLTKVRVIRLVVKTERASIVEVDGELIREAATEDLSRSRHFLLHDTIIFLLLRSSLEPLPRKRATTEVEHNIAQRLHIVTTRLLYIPVSFRTV